MHGTIYAGACKSVNLGVSLVGSVLNNLPVNVLYNVALKYVVINCI